MNAPRHGCHGAARQPSIPSLTLAPACHTPTIQETKLVLSPSCFVRHAAIHFSMTRTSVTHHFPTLRRAKVLWSSCNYIEPLPRLANSSLRLQYQRHRHRRRPQTPVATQGDVDRSTGASFAARSEVAASAAQEQELQGSCWGRATRSRGSFPCTTLNCIRCLSLHAAPAKHGARWQTLWAATGKGRLACKGWYLGAETPSCCMVAAAHEAAPKPHPQLAQPPARQFESMGSSLVAHMCSMSSGAQPLGAQPSGTACAAFGQQR